MTNDEAIKMLVNATYSEEWQGNERLTEAQNMAISALERDRWHSELSEFPPKKVGDDGYTGYLVFSDGYIQVADFVALGGAIPYAYEFHVDGEYDPDVTHWMQLPDPPKEET